jgi:hypothetical protein
MAETAETAAALKHSSGHTPRQQPYTLAAAIQFSSQYFEMKTYPLVSIVHIEFKLLAVCFHCLMGSWNHERGH